MPLFLARKQNKFSCFALLWQCLDLRWNHYAFKFVHKTSISESKYVRVAVLSMLLLAITTNSCLFRLGRSTHVECILVIFSLEHIWKGLFLFVLQWIYTVPSDYYMDNFYIVYVLISLLAMNSPISTVSTISFLCIVSWAVVPRSHRLPISCIGFDVCGIK